MIRIHVDLSLRSAVTRDSAVLKLKYHDLVWSNLRNEMGISAFFCYLVPIEVLGQQRNGSFPSSRPNSVTIGALFTFNSTIGRAARTGIEVAIEDVNANSSILPGTRVDVIFQDTNCSGFVGTMEVIAVNAREVVQGKAESAIPVTTPSPLEGNTTFLGGTIWCVALPGVPQDDLQNALDWACGLRMADCSPVQTGGGCFQPNTLLSHASYAFNSYFQHNGNSEIGCNFGGTATITSRDPSYGSCTYPTSGPAASSAPPHLSNTLFRRQGFISWEHIDILLLLYFRN